MADSVTVTNHGAAPLQKSVGPLPNQTGPGEIVTQKTDVPEGVKNSREGTGSSFDGAARGGSVDMGGASPAPLGPSDVSDICRPSATPKAWE